jgi:hypothetical protein
MSPRPAATLIDGREVPEDRVERDPSGQVFQVREATTQGDTPAPRRRGRAADSPGQVFQVREAVTVGEAPAEAPPGQPFTVREAGTEYVEPPHWAALREKDSSKFKVQSSK